MGWEERSCVADRGNLIFRQPTSKIKMKKISHPEESLMEQALRHSKTKTLDELRDMTGIPSSWLRKFRSNKIADPSVNRIEKLLKAFGVALVTPAK